MIRSDDLTVDKIVVESEATSFQPMFNGSSRSVNSVSAFSSDTASLESSSRNVDSSKAIPQGWVLSYSKRLKREFYYHKSSSTSQWHAPTLSEVENPAHAKAETQRKAREEHGSDEAVKRYKASGIPNSRICG